MIPQAWQKLTGAALLLLLVCQTGAGRSKETSICFSDFCLDNLEIREETWFIPNALPVYQPIKLAIATLRSLGKPLTDPIIRFTEISAIGQEIGEKAEQGITTVKPGNRWGFTVKIDPYAAGISKVNIKASTASGLLDQTYSFHPMFYSKKDAKQYEKSKSIP